MLGYWQHDVAHNGYYSAPDGVGSDDPCLHAPRRMGIGPTGSKVPMFTADVCGRCGRIMRSVSALTWKQYFWMEVASRTDLSEAVRRAAREKLRQFAARDPMLSVQYVDGQDNQ